MVCYVNIDAPSDINMTYQENWKEIVKSVIDISAY